MRCLISFTQCCGGTYCFDVVRVGSVFRLLRGKVSTLLVQELKGMLREALGVLEPSTSTFSSPSARITGAASSAHSSIDFHETRGSGEVDMGNDLGFCGPSERGTRGLEARRR